jgi:hypothetical protein
MWAIYSWLFYKYTIGSPLEVLDADFSLYLKQMKSLKRDQATFLTKAWRQVFLNLLGRDNADQPTRFSGNSQSEEELKLLRQNDFFDRLFFALQGILFTYYGEYVQYADMIIKVGHDHLQKVHVGLPYNLWDTFLKGVSCFAAAHQTGKSKYFKMGQIFRSKIHEWLDMGNPNVAHYGALLDAERASFYGKEDAAIKHYEDAILLSARGGYLHDAAVATERCGEFYLTVMGDRDEAGYQISQSIKYWREWGSVSKVRHLEEKYADLLPKKA